MEYFYLLIIGLVAGTLSGLLGIGGSIVILPCLGLVFPHQPYHQHAAAAMIVNSIACMSGAWRHHRAHLVQKKVIVGMIPAAAFSVCVGVWLSNLSFFTTGHPEYLSRVLALCLAYVVISNTVKIFGKPDRDDQTCSEPSPALPFWRSLLPGLMMGLPAGLLGVGGGFVAIPAQQKVLGTRLRNAIANSTALIVFSAAIGAVYKNWALSAVEGATAAESLRIAGLIVPAAVLGGFLGAKLMHVSPLRLLRLVFICYLLWAAYSQWTYQPQPALRQVPSGPAATIEDLVANRALIVR